MFLNNAGWSSERIGTFLDKSEAYTGPWGMVQIGVFEHDGWVVQLPPDEFPYPMYFNRECEKLFDVLGEL